MPGGEAINALNFTSAFGGIADIAGLTTWLDPVANGPKATLTLQAQSHQKHDARNRASYCNVRRYSFGVMPVARRNARVKLDCEENRDSRAISESDARPVASIALALSSRRWLTWRCGGTPVAAANARVK